MLKVYIISTKTLINESSYKKAFSCLNSERQKKALALKNENSRLQSVAAGYLIYYALKELNIELKDLTFIKGFKDKPYIKECPDIFFNLSHSNEYAALAISDKEVGIDLEKFRPLHPSVAQKAFGQETTAFLKSLPKAMQPKEFIRLWTKKESYGKYTGEGIVSVLSSKEAPDLDRAELHFHTYDKIEGYYLTVCTPVQSAPEYEYITKI